jgi:hypothetical protein
MAEDELLAGMAEDELIDAIRETIIFLRMAMAELRQIAARSEPEVARELRHMADQCEAEANAFSERFGIAP